MCSEKVGLTGFFYCFRRDYGAAGALNIEGGVGLLYNIIAAVVGLIV